MPSDGSGQNQGVMTSSTQPPSSRAKAAPRSDGYTTPAHVTTALPGNLAPLTQPGMDPPLAPSSAQTLLEEPPGQPVYSTGSSFFPRGYPESSQRTLLPALSSAKEPISLRDDPTGPLNVPSPSSFPIVSRCNHARRIHLAYFHPQTLVSITSSSPRSPPTSSPRPAPIERHRHAHAEYDTRYSDGRMTPDQFLYSPVCDSGYVPETIAQVPPSTTVTCLTSRFNVPFHLPLQPSLYSGAGMPSTTPTFDISMHATYRSITQQVVSDAGRQSPLSTPISNTLQTKVGLTADSYLGMSVSRAPSSSIPMSNGTPTSLSAIQDPALPWYPISGLASVSELKADGTFVPPILPHLHLPPLAPQQYPDSHTHDSRIGVIAPQSTPDVDVIDMEAVEGVVGQEKSQDRNQDLKPPVKKKKKSKMHGCTVCGKEFPRQVQSLTGIFTCSSAYPSLPLSPPTRPSGLHTHMNTHNNTKPYPCTFPGCDRTFGVRSNAKRHLRTHGITSNSYMISVPTGQSVAGSSGQMLSSAASDSQPYVVGFSEPVIAREPIIIEEREASRGSDSQTGTDGDWTTTSGAALGGVSTPSGYPGPPFFKLRWLPPSLTSRTNAAALRSVSDRDVFEDDGDGEEPEEGGAEESSGGDDYSASSSNI